MFATFKSTRPAFPLDRDGRRKEIPAVVKLVILICKGLIRSQHSRRQLMFYIALGAMLLLFAGSTVLQGILRATPLLFVGYWLAVMWLTATVALLAVFDLLMVRREARAERRKLEREYLAAKTREEK